MAEGAHPAATIPRTAIQGDGAHPQFTKRALADKCRAGEAGGGGRMWRRGAVSGVKRRRKVGWAAAEELRGMRGMWRIHDIRSSRANRLVNQAVQSPVCQAQISKASVFGTTKVQQHKRQ